MSAVGTPIKREDIKAGDRIRRSVVSEYTAARDGEPLREDQPYEYILLERPVTMPTENGLYVHSGAPLGACPIILRLRDGKWECLTAERTPSDAAELATAWQAKGILVRLVHEPPAQVVPDKLLERLKDAASIYLQPNTSRFILRRLIEELEVTK